MNACERVTEKSLSRLPVTLSKLSKLHLMSCKLSGNMFKNCTLAFVCLNLSNCSGVSDVTLDAITQVSVHLKELNVSYTKISDVAIQQLSERCTSLIRLNAIGCESLTDRGVSSLSKCNQMISLELGGMRNLRDPRINFPKLEKLTLTSCRNITAATLNQIAECSTNLIELVSEFSVKFLTIFSGLVEL